jgi:hypothetical protein
MTEYIYIAICVAILYLILKLAINKYNKSKEQQKDVFKDSIFVGIIVLSVLYGKDYFSKHGEKTKVFTNEPDF